MSDVYYGERERELTLWEKQPLRWWRVRGGEARACSSVVRVAEFLKDVMRSMYFEGPVADISS